MAEHRFQLEKGGVKHACPACRQIRFVRYVDSFTGEQVADEVGRCDRESSCGYHFTPKEYFYLTGKNPFDVPKPAIKPQPKPEPVEPSFIDTKVVQASLTRYNQNNFCRWLCSVFGKDRAFELTAAYKIGTSKYWQGSCVFWQIDRDGKARAGKVMLYDDSGSRVKKPFAHVQWVHEVMQIQPYHLQQCLFGEHLLSTDSDKPVAVVESEKTAIVASGFIPGLLWVATGGKNNKVREKLQTLIGRKVKLYPDLKAFDDWRKVAAGLPGVTVSDILERRATESDRAAGLDLADYLLREQTDSVTTKH